MRQSQFLAQFDKAKKTSSLDNLIRLWYAAEEVTGTSASTFQEECELEPFKDKISDEQHLVARLILKQRTTNLTHILDKLKMWESAYLPSTFLNGGDTYRMMVVSAMKDLQSLLSISTKS